MENMENIKKSILDTLNERITSPLFGSFIISWAIWNYKTIFIMLSTKTVEDKFSYIEEIIYSDWWSFPLIGFAYPLITSILFILIFPHPEKLVYGYWYTHKENLKKQKQKIEDIRLLTLEESRMYRKKNIELESEYNKEIDSKNLEIQTLKEIIENNEKNDSVKGDIIHGASAYEKIRDVPYISKIKYEKKEIAAMYNYSADEIDFLEFLYNWTYEEQTLYDFKNNVMSTVPMSMIIVKHLIEKFTDQEEILWISKNQRGDPIIRITKEGSNLLKSMFGNIN